MIYMKLASINFSSTPETLCNIRRDARRSETGSVRREEEGEKGHSRNFLGERGKVGETRPPSQREKREK